MVTHTHGVWQRHVHTPLVQEGFTSFLIWHSPPHGINERRNYGSLTQLFCLFARYLHVPPSRSRLYTASTDFLGSITVSFALEVHAVLFLTHSSQHFLLRYEAEVQSCSCCFASCIIPYKKRQSIPSHQAPLYFLLWGRSCRQSFDAGYRMLASATATFSHLLEFTFLPHFWSMRHPCFWFLVFPATGCALSFLSVHPAVRLALLFLLLVPAVGYALLLFQSPIGPSLSQSPLPAGILLCLRHRLLEHHFSPLLHRLCHSDGFVRQIHPVLCPLLILGDA